MNQNLFLCLAVLAGLFVGDSLLAQSKPKNDPNVEFVVIQSTFEGHRINTADKLKPTAAKYKLPIPFGQSAGGGTPAIMQKYRTRGTPWVVLIDKTGLVQFNNFHLDPAKASSIIDQLKNR